MLDNEVAQTIIGYCDGGTSIATIGEQIAARFEGPLDTVTRDVASMVIALVEGSFLELTDGGGEA